MPLRRHFTWPTHKFDRGRQKIPAQGTGVRVLFVVLLIYPGYKSNTGLIRLGLSATQYVWFQVQMLTTKKKIFFCGYLDWYISLFVQPIIGLTCIYYCDFILLWLLEIWKWILVYLLLFLRLRLPPFYLRYCVWVLKGKGKTYPTCVGRAAGSYRGRVFLYFKRKTKRRFIASLKLYIYGTMHLSDILRWFF